MGQVLLAPRPACAGKSAVGYFNLGLALSSPEISQDGVTFTIDGWFSNKQEICPWRRLRSEIDNGEVVITDISNSKCKISLPLATVDNAIALHLMINNQS